jgi:hypothetical protein
MLGFKQAGGPLYAWRHADGQSADAPIDVSALAEASLGPGPSANPDLWFDVSANGQWMIMLSERSVGNGWPVLFISSMSDFPNSLDFHPVKNGSWEYHPDSIHRVSNDGLTIYGINSEDSSQLCRFDRPDTTATTFTQTDIYAGGTASWSHVFLSRDEADIVVQGTSSNVVRVQAAAPHTAETLMAEANLGGAVFEGYPCQNSARMLVCELSGNGNDEGICVFTAHNPNEAYSDISGVNGNDNAPHVWDDAASEICASLCLSRPGGASIHEILMRKLDGSGSIFPEPLWGIDVVSGSFTFWAQ